MSINVLHHPRPHRPRQLLQPQLLRLRCRRQTTIINVLLHRHRPSSSPFSMSSTALGACSSSSFICVRQRRPIADKGVEFVVCQQESACVFVFGDACRACRTGCLFFCVHQTCQCGVCFVCFRPRRCFVSSCVRTSAPCRLCHSAHLRERRGTPLQCMMDASAMLPSSCRRRASRFCRADAALFSELERRWKAGNRLRYCASRSRAAKTTCSKTCRRDALRLCTKCKAANCAQCRTLWHAGLTCEKFQALPEQLRSPEDAHLLKLAQKEGWRQCPRCKNMIAKNADDCKFVRCKCGCRLLLRLRRAVQVARRHR
jgi:hypothetical protein